MYRTIRLTISLALAVLASTAYGKTLTVGHPNTPCPHPQFTTISAAIAAASPGDEIDICPALYPEQLLITKRLTLRGIAVNDVDRILVRPASMTNLGGISAEAVVTVMNTRDVHIENLAIDAGSNTVAGCDPSLAGVHFLNSSGELSTSAVFGALLADAKSCAGFFGNGFGVLVDTDGTQAGPFRVEVEQSSIHDFTRDGITAFGTGVSVEIEDNAISGVGPSIGVPQFGVFVRDGAVARITGNVITEDTCGSIPMGDCFNARSEGVVLRAAADGTVVERNVIARAQSGIFVNGGNDTRVEHNLVSDIDLLDGIHLQSAATGFFTNNVIEGNRIFNVTPVENQSCGISETPDGGSYGHNRFVNNTVNDAYCGVAYHTADRVESGHYFNTLYETINIDQNPTPPPPTEP